MSYLLMDSCLNANDLDLIFKKFSNFSHKLVVLDIFVTELPDEIKKRFNRLVNKGVFSIVSTDEESPEEIDKFATSNKLRNIISQKESTAIYMAKKLGCGIVAMEPVVVRLLRKLGFEPLSVLPSGILIMIRGETFPKANPNIPLATVKRTVVSVGSNIGDT